MNAPLSDAVLAALRDVTLDDKYALPHGRAFMSGVQALVRLPLLQKQRDLAQGRNTAGFISGYRGSPLGGYDFALQSAKDHLRRHDIVFQPGVNEELGATAVWGTQQLGFAPAEARRFDGVFGIWYGKGPGVDRCLDVFKHANMGGTTAWGGVLAIAGDDHIAKSSTTAHQSDHVFQACGMPAFYPSSVQDILDHGLAAIALSRWCGLWSGMKVVQEVVESSASVEIDLARVRMAAPADFDLPPGGLHVRWPDGYLAQEERYLTQKLPAMQAWLRANPINRDIVAGPADRLGIMASGKAYGDTRQALLDLGLDDATCRRIGLRLHKVGLVWPLEPVATRAFAAGLTEILVVEEKRPFVELQVKEILYGLRDADRPRVSGKTDPHDVPLLRSHADLSPALIARAVARRLGALGVDADTERRMDRQIAALDAKDAEMRVLDVRADRTPWFCSGCPHNTSTRVPEGSRAVAGIGCHFMAIRMDRATTGFTQMGGEGVTWVGQQPFLDESHIFANLGDGTYFHSGLLAVRQSIAAGVDITYKLLYNDAVAMTGGQQVGERPEGHTVLQMVASLRAEGVTRLEIVTDEPEKYTDSGIDPTVRVHHRDELDAVQMSFRDTRGTTVIVYDQTCATEKRRRRPRGTLAAATRVAVINPLVCEGCGDCGTQSNCLSVEPLETEFGRKRQVNQSTCNQDLSCVNGFCPSFVTVEGKLAKHAPARAAVDEALPPDVPEPALLDLRAIGHPYGIVVAGQGGTGVVTVGQLLGVAAHIEGVGIVTQDATGAAQKGGNTWSHVLLAGHPDDVRTTRVSTVGADLVIGCDPIVTAGRETVLRMSRGRTRVALCAHTTPTAAFVRDGNWRDPTDDCIIGIRQAVGDEGLAAFDANAAAVALLADSLFANPMVLGFAWQRGWVPLRRESLRRAIELNAVGVKNNLAAFEWGRLAAHDSARFEATVASRGAQPSVVTFHARPSVDQIIATRKAFLVDYQDAAYADAYLAVVAAVRQAEAHLSTTTLTEAVARNLFKLMAYKDEYEVARLHGDRGFEAKVAAMFDGPFKRHFHLAPPLFAKRNERGELRKRPFGPSMAIVFRLLAPLKRLRGTPFDPFGRTHERRTERALIARYRADLQRLLPGLSAANHAATVAFARMPEGIKGYGHVKQRHLDATLPKWDAALQAVRVDKDTP